MKTGLESLFLYLFARVWCFFFHCLFQIRKRGISLTLTDYEPKKMPKSTNKMCKLQTMIHILYFFSSLGFKIHTKYMHIHMFTHITYTKHDWCTRENGASMRDWLNEFSIAPNTMYYVKWRVEKSSFLFDFQLYEHKRGSRRLSGIYLCLIYLSCSIPLASDTVSIIGIYLVFIRIFIRIFLQPTVEGKRFINFLPFYD